MRHIYQPRGVCSSEMRLEIEDGILRRVEIEDGCEGNLQGICRLVEGRPAREVADRLSGIRCGRKPTSCPDQLAAAIRRALEEQE